jgi:hypothetical protein
MLATGKAYSEIRDEPCSKGQISFALYTRVRWVDHWVRIPWRIKWKS